MSRWYSACCSQFEECFDPWRDRLAEVFHDPRRPDELTLLLARYLGRVR